MKVEAKEYLIKLKKICDDYEKKQMCGEGCPLLQFGCGLPKDDDKIDALIEAVEQYEEKTYPFGRCKACGKEFNSELLNEYRIKHCLWCGEKIGGERNE